MKLLNFLHNGVEQLGILSECGKYIYPFYSIGLKYGSMLEFIENHNTEDLEVLKKKRDINIGICIEDITFCPPIPNPKKDLICIGLNYTKHVEESQKFKNVDYGKREKSVYFSKRVDRAVPHNGFIQSHDDITGQLDYEAELTVIIGKEGRYIPRDKVFDYIFGFTIMNDVSARDIQNAHKQFYFGKSLDGFCPMGPWIVTRDEFSEPVHVNVKSYVNGELRQDANTKDLIFDIPHIISELSQGITLCPGDIILTGTPSGVGMGIQPPKWLKSGDVVECEVEGIGVLKNTIK